MTEAWSPKASSPRGPDWAVPARTAAVLLDTASAINTPRMIRLAAAQMPTATRPITLVAPASDSESPMAESVGLAPILVRYCQLRDRLLPVPLTGQRPLAGRSPHLFVARRREP